MAMSTFDAGYIYKGRSCTNSNAVITYIIQMFQLVTPLGSQAERGSDTIHTHDIQQFMHTKD